MKEKEDSNEYSASFVKEDPQNNSNSQDSFNKDLQKIYEEHKKSETKVPHRPISSYTSNRNFNKVNQELDTVKQIKNKPQSAQQTKSNNNSKNSKDNKEQNNKEQNNKESNNKEQNKNKELTFEEILNDLNKFILTNKIKRADFIDNPNVFLNFEDFKDVFQQIHYTLPKKYLKLLFNHNNEEGAKENYILMSNFIKNLTFYKIEGVGNDSDVSKIENSNLSYSNSKLEGISESKSLFDKNNVNYKSNYKMKYINEQYNQFNKDIIDILNNAKKNSFNNFLNNNSKKNKSKSFGASKISIESKPKLINNEEDKTKENFNINNNPSFINSLNNTKQNKFTEVSKKYDYETILKNMEKEAEKEDNYIRYQFDKRDKSFLKDCVYKCEECNHISNILDLNRVYSIVFDDEMKCKIEEKDKKDRLLSLKELIIEWRILYKRYYQKETLEKYKEQEDSNKNKNAEMILNEKKKEKEEKQNQIKEVLIEAVRLKTKLKTQLDDLKSNIKIDEKVVLEHLCRAGVEIPGYKGCSGSFSGEGNK